MANTKKYVSLDKLGLYDEKIKALINANDTTTLNSANAYADSLASNYDAAGTAATKAAAAEAAAKGYTDEQIEAVNGVVAGVKATAEQGVADAATADGKAVAAQAAADAAQAAADAAQGDVDALAGYVGTFTASEGVDTVVKYIDAKTAGIASDAALTALAERVTAAEGNIDVIKDDYLTSEDKEELSDLITAEKNRAEGIEGGLNTRLATVEADYLKAADKTALQGSIDGVSGRVTTIENDYLKAADKTELEGKINAKVAQADYDAKVEEIKGTTDGLQNQINLIMNNPDTEKVVDSITEFTAWVEEHGTLAEGMRTDINTNATAIENEAKAARAAEEALSGRLDALEGIDHEAYVAADTALKNELNAAIALKADTTALTEAVEALENADADMAEDIEFLMTIVDGDGIGSVAAQIETAKQEAIDAAATDAANKDAVVLSEAQKYADGLNTAMAARVDALEAVDHEHANKALLDTYTQTEANLADAVAKKHAHENASVLDGITAAKVSAWDAAEGNAKTYADGLNTAMTTKVDAIGERVTANEGAITTVNTELAKKAAQTDLDAVSGRVTTLETWHANFVECSQEDINQLFA